MSPWLGRAGCGCCRPVINRQFLLIQDRLTINTFALVDTKPVRPEYRPESYSIPGLASLVVHALI